jgi:hypothetical protein
MLTEKQYQRLVGYSFTLCKDHSLKHDFVHDGWLYYQKYSKIKPTNDDELIKLLTFHIKQSFIKFNRRLSNGKWILKPITFTDNIVSFSEAVEYQPEQPSQRLLKAITATYSRDKYKPRIQYMITAFKLKKTN